jgi:hypothetical protein
MERENNRSKSEGASLLPREAAHLSLECINPFQAPGGSYQSGETDSEATDYTHAGAWLSNALGVNSRNRPSKIVEQNPRLREK